MKVSFLSLCLIFIIGFILTGCGGSGSSGTSSTVSSANNETGKIEGNISELSTSPSERNYDVISYLKGFLLLQKAFAQEGGFCGINVSVEREGVTIDSTEANCDGSFILDDIDPGLVLLIFEVDGVNMSIPLNIPSGGTVEVNVSLESAGVKVNELNVVSGPVSCGEGFRELGGEDVNNVVIEGDGKNCINAEGSCEVSLIAENVDLRGCNFCARANGNSSVFIVADGGNINCTASDDGINTNDFSFVEIQATKNIEIVSSGEDGIDASGQSGVRLLSERCKIQAHKYSILKDTEENVITDQCTELLEESGEEPEDGENGDENGDGDMGMEENMDDDPVESAGGACEFDCIDNRCELFCSDGIPADCVDICSGADNFPLCIQECTGFECSSPACDEYCVEETLECETGEICEEVCDGEPVCEEICVERECIEFACEEICVERECLKFACEEVCEGEGEQRLCEEVCGDVCLEFGECLRFEEECSDDCIEFGECIRFEEECECETEVVECEEIEECDEVCEKFALGCRFECESGL